MNYGARNLEVVSVITSLNDLIWDNSNNLFYG